MRLFMIALLLTLAVPSQSTGQERSRPSSPQRGGISPRNDPAVQNVAPFQIFDNLYYIGMQWVGAYFLTTSDGLIMIDALYGEFVDHALDGIRKMGFDPADIKYVFVTHGHFDHVGGAAAIKKVSGARVGMTDADWKMVEEGRGGGRGSSEPLARDLVIQDGDSITLGDTTFKFYRTPGHTPGVLSMEFTVYDNGKPHKAFTFGGVGLNFSGVERTEMYIASVKRLQAMEGIEVSVPNHASMGGVFQRAERLAERKAGEPHPFVAPEDFQRWLDELLVNVQEKLEEEKKREAEGTGR